MRKTGNLRKKAHRQPSAIERSAVSSVAVVEQDRTLGGLNQIPRCPQCASVLCPPGTMLVERARCGVCGWSEAVR